MIFRIHLIDSRHVDIDGETLSPGASEAAQLDGADEMFAGLVSTCQTFRFQDGDGRWQFIPTHAIVRIECIPAAEYGRPAAEALAGAVVQHLGVPSIGNLHP